VFERKRVIVSKLFSYIYFTESIALRKFA